MDAFRLGASPPQGQRPAAMTERFGSSIPALLILWGAALRHSAKYAAECAAKVGEFRKLRTLAG